MTLRMHSSSHHTARKGRGLIAVLSDQVVLMKMQVPMGNTRSTPYRALPACNVCPGLALCSAFLTPISNKPNGGERLDDGVHRGRTCQTPFQRLKHPPLLPCEMVLPRGCTQTLVRLVRLVTRDVR